MSSCINKIILLGYLGADPETRTLQNGNQFVVLSVATNERRKDASGTQQQRTEWHRVVIFNEHLGRLAADHLTKGLRVYVEGTLQTRKWVDDNNQKRTTVEVIIPRYGGDLVLLDRPGQQQDGRLRDAVKITEIPY